jgi:hypothetical protein
VKLILEEEARGQAGQSEGALHEVDKHDRTQVRLDAENLGTSRDAAWRVRLLLHCELADMVTVLLFFAFSAHVLRH